MFKEKGREEWIWGRGEVVGGSGRSGRVWLGWDVIYERGKNKVYINKDALIAKDIHYLVKRCDLSFSASVNEEGATICFWRQSLILHIMKIYAYVNLSTI